MSFLRIGDFILAPGERKLTRNGIELPLGARAFDMLCLLIANRHRVLTKSEILDAIWPDIAVEESNLTVQISALRKALGPKSLVTIPGRGYQFVLSVEEDVPVADTPAQTNGRANPRILVLPFANVSNDSDQDYFSDGIAEDIITDLSKVSALSVVARSTAFSLKGLTIDVSEVAGRLDVTHIVEGSVRKSGNRLRINTQLVDAATGHPIWAERFDRDLTDIFALQDEIARAVISALRLKLFESERAALTQRPTDNPQAYEIYLQARHHHYRADMRNSLIASRLARQALDIDPNYDLAWALLAACQACLHGVSPSEADGLDAAERALALNPDLPEALAAKGRVLAGLLQFEEALVLHERSMQLDQNSYDVRLHFGRTCFLMGRHDEAIAHWERASELHRDAIPCLTMLTMSYTETGQTEKAEDASRRAMERIDRALEEDPTDTFVLTYKVLGLAHYGQAEQAKQLALRVKAIDPESPGIDFNLACAMALLGEAETALDFLEKCFSRVNAAQFVAWSKRDTDLDSLRDMPRFKRLLGDLEARAASARAASIH